jgi:hypothetical protein
VTYLGYEGRPLPHQRWRNKRCPCYGNGPVNTPLLPSTAVTWQRFPLWSNTRHRCWFRQQAIGNGIKTGGAVCEVSLWSSATEDSQWLVSYEAVWIVKSPNPVKSIVTELYSVHGSDHRRSCNCDTADGSSCESVNCVSVERMWNKFAILNTAWSYLSRVIHPTRDNTLWLLKSLKCQ